MSVPENLLYSKEHEWVKMDGDTATVGVTDYAQTSLGDIVYVELPKVGAKVEQFGNVGVIESVKAVSDLFTPIAGEILEVNPTLDTDPAVVNKDPYGDGWLIKLRVSNPADTGKLLSPAEYEKIATD